MRHDGHRFGIRDDIRIVDPFHGFEVYVVFILGAGSNGRLWRYDSGWNEASRFGSRNGGRAELFLLQLDGLAT